MIFVLQLEFVILQLVCPAGTGGKFSWTSPYGIDDYENIAPIFWRLTLWEISINFANLICHADWILMVVSAGSGGRFDSALGVDDYEIGDYENQVFYYLTFDVIEPFFLD